MKGKIKFGTDGWRAIIGKDYTTDGVLRVSEGVAIWMKSKGFKKVVIGYDCRFGGLMFATAAASAFVQHDIQVLFDREVVTTPMVALGILDHKADVGVVITASHNPASYNGFKLKANYGGPSVQKDIDEVESSIPLVPSCVMRDFSDLEANKLLSFVDLERSYVERIESHFDMQRLRDYQSQMVYDSMYGAGQKVMKSLFPDAIHLHSDLNPSFGGIPPEPLDRNLKELSQIIKSTPSLKFGLANDGDADRLGMYDEDGNFVNSHCLLLLILRYLYEHKNMRSGKVICSFSATDKLEWLAKSYGLEYVSTPIGFKHIAEYMSTEDVLMAGEESGGIAVKGHIPERDGIWSGLLIMEYMATSGKSLKELVLDLFSKVGQFEYERSDLHLSPSERDLAVLKCEGGLIKIGDYKVRRMDDLDGFKFFLDNGGWVMVRPSGTEPVLRIYAQAPDKEEVKKVLEQTKQTLLS